MFTGIVENIVVIKSITPEGSNKHFSFSCPFTDELYIDQSISHNGICLTITNILQDEYTITAIEETLRKTNLNDLLIGDRVNIERAALMNTRMDGHFVQGHVDKVVRCTEIQEHEGSWTFVFAINGSDAKFLVNKGSVCINGVSLTVVEVSDDFFSVAIIPYTFEHTNFKWLKTGDNVNIEFDILGKYIVQYLDKLSSSGHIKR